MITSIILNDVASYQSKVQINTNAKINLFYGLNGSGKTTISRFLRNPKSPEFNQCALYPILINLEKEIFIYNQDYIDENFHQNSEQQGIFTIGKDAIEAEKRLESIEVKFKRTKKVEEDINSKLEDLSQEKGEKLQILMDSLYKDYKQQYDKTDLSRCLKNHMGSKKLFLEKIRTTLYKADLNYTFKDLLDAEAELQKNKGKSLSLLPTLDTVRLEGIIQDIVWETSFINSGGSNLNKIIDELGNLSWVQKGMNSYLEKSQGVCPFCQKRLSNNFGDELKKVFDESYKSAQRDIESKKNLYLESVYSLKEKIGEISQLDEFYKYIDHSSFNLRCRELYELLDSNEKFIIKKQENPSLSILINSISELIKVLNLLIIEANKLIMAFNSRVSEFVVSEKNITNQFWTLIRCESNLKLDEYDKFYLSSVKKELRYKRQLGRLIPIKKSLEEQKKIELTKTTNIEESRDKINARLHSLGVEGVIPTIYARNP